MFEVRQEVHDVYDLTNLLSAYVQYEEEALMDRVSDQPIPIICKALYAHGIVDDANELEAKAIEDATKNSIYEVGYEGFMPVSHALGIDHETVESIEELSFLVAVTAMDNPNYWEELISRVEWYLQDLIDEDDGGYDEDRWMECWDHWDKTKKKALKDRMYKRFGVTIDC